MIIKGMDISFVDEIEAGGGAYYDNGQRQDVLDIVQANGVNSIRLRIWNDPPGGYCNLERTLMMAKRIKSRGLHWLLDFHYSDKWADPANQWKPKAWEELSHGELCDAVYRYTADVLASLSLQGTCPDMVQVGNEITPGMLWDDGRVDGEYDTEERWEAFTALIKSGIAAVKDTAPSAQIMLHIDRGADWPATQIFYERMRKHKVDYDVIGQSYYPWWHGTLDELRHNLDQTAREFGKPIVVVETAYPWTLTPVAGRSFIVEREDQLHEGYSATEDGQAAYISDLLALVANTPDGLGAGFYWWEPTWIPSQEHWSVGHPNNWSNLTLFNYEGHKLASLEALKPI